MDLTGGLLNVESLLNASGFDAVSVAATGAKGVDTNGDWNTNFALTPTTAQSSFFSRPAILFVADQSQCYEVTNQPNGSPITIYRSVFVQNNSGSGVSYNVYIDDPNTLGLGFEAGAAHVEWVGNYIDPATGNPVTGYLYLTDDYARGATTNAYLGGVPDNFSFLTSPTQLLFKPASPSSFPTFPDLFITNNYVLYERRLVVQFREPRMPAAPIPPAASPISPGAVRITASRELNLANATISGVNYLRLKARTSLTEVRARSIAAPYSDIYPWRDERIPDHQQSIDGRHSYLERHGSGFQQR